MSDSGPEDPAAGDPSRRPESGGGPLAARYRVKRLDEGRAAYERKAWGEAATALSPVVEREQLLEHSAARESTLTGSAERRLMRLGFDLHDGAIQNVLALAADVRLAGRSARFDTRFLDLGIHPGGGHTWMLRRIVGPQAAMSMVVFGERLDGAEAERVGLVWRCVEDADLLDTAVHMAARAAAGPPELTRRIKATIGDVADIAVHADAVDRELGDQLWSMDQPAFAERLAQLQARISGAD